MKKGWKIFWLTCGITLVVGIALLGIGLGMGATMEIVKERAPIKETYSPNIQESYQGIRELDLDIAAGEIKILKAPKEQQEITARLNQFEKEMSFNYIPGVVAFMEDLRAHGVKIAIVTSSNDLKMANVYKAHPELKELVDRILTAEMFTRSKPAPDCFLLGAEVFDTVVENCVVFEDSFHGLEAGNAANMAVVGLCTTNSAEAIADKCKLVIPDFTAFSFEKMKALLA